MALIMWVIAGTVIGLLGRAIMPGRKRIAVWQAILCGIGGVFVGAIAYGLIVYDGNGGAGIGVQWLMSIAGAVLFVIAFSLLSGRRPRAQRLETPDQVRQVSAAVVPGPAPHIFLSYRREDAQALAGRIADHLKQHRPESVVFFDVDSIAPGVNFRVTISQALQRSHVLLAVIDRHWTGTASGPWRLYQPDDFVAFELRTAAQLRIPIIPIVDPYATMPPAAALPPDLAWFADQQALHLHHDIAFDREMSRLDDRLVALLPQRQAQAAPAQTVTPRPSAPGGSTRPARWLGTVIGGLVIVILVIFILRLT